MTKTTIGPLMEQASKALAQTQYATCERLCLEAIDLARQSQDYDSLARIVMPLQEARRQRRQIACDHGVHILGEPKQTVDALLAQHPCGCLMLTAPTYGPSDAQALTWASRQRDLYVEVLLLDEGSKRQAFEWLMEQNGDRILATCNQKPAQAQLESLLQQLQSIGDHEIAHQRVADLARQWARRRTQGP